MGAAGVGVGIAAAISIAPKTVAARHLHHSLKPHSRFPFFSLYCASPNPRTTTTTTLPLPLFHLHRRSLHSPPFSPSRRYFCAATLHSGEAALHSTAAPQKVGEFRRKLRVVDVKGGPDQGLDKLGHNLVLTGWVRTLRVQSSVTFVEINDGSCLSNMQCVMNSEAKGYDQNLA